MKKILSVVIPTYNMEKYLRNCLNSFIFDENETELEILIVNDGSKDNSLNIAKEYEAKYPNIFKVIEKENGGHGSTVNAGLRVATGKYFKVVDSDDWVDTEQFKLLFSKLKELDVDCVVCNYNQVIEPSNKIKFVNCQMAKYNTITPINNANSFLFFMAGTTFKTETIKDIKIDEKCFYVDVEYNELCTAKCKDFINLELNVYRYRIGRFGQSISAEGFYKHRFDHFRVIKTLVENKNINDSKLIKVDCCGTIKDHYTYYSIIYSIDKSVVNELIEFDNYIKQYPEIYQFTNDYKIVKNMRKKNFKNVGLYNRIYKLKKFVKRCLGRA